MSTANNSRNRYVLDVDLALHARYTVYIQKNELER